MTDNAVWLFNIKPHNWRRCVDGPSKNSVHDDHVDNPWHGLSDYIGYKASRMRQGELAIVRRSQSGILGLWKIAETRPVQSQRHHDWPEEYAYFVYCRPLIREFNRPIDDTEFVDGQEYVRFNTGANELDEQYIQRFISNMLKRREFPESVTKRLSQALEQAGGTPPEDGPNAGGTSSNSESETIASSEQRDENESVADLPTPDRTTTQVSRIIRNTELAKQLKEQYNYTCQVCNGRRRRGPSTGYAEAHHLHPLGANDPGPDAKENILILCPDHHADFDYGMIEVDPETLEIQHAYEDTMSGRTLTLHADHNLNRRFLEHHNERISQI